MDRVIEGLCNKFQSDHGLNALPGDEVFECFVGYYFTKSLHEVDFDPQEFRMGGGGDLAIDTAAIIINGDLLIDAADVIDAVDQAKSLDVHFILTQGKRSEGFSSAVFTELADNIKNIFSRNRIPYQSSPEIENLSKCVEAIYSNIAKFKPDLPSISVAYCTTGRTGDALLEQKRLSAESAIDDMNLFSSVNCFAVGAKELRNYCRRATEAVEVEFSMPRKVSMPRIPNVEQAHLGLLPAKELVRIITDPGGAIRKNLFYENVRDFQDYNPVNLEIQSTIRDATKRNGFAVLNNGVTIVARTLTVAGEDFVMSDFQIVNGCQTCHVLFDEKDLLADDTWVNVKIIQSKDEEVISGITAATNRQTAVTDEDLEAREHFHKELEDLFSTYSDEKKLYYERRSQQYRSVEGVERTRIISRGVLTRSFASMFLDEPARAGRYFKELRDARKKDLFRDNQSPVAYYTSAFSIYRIEWLFRNRKVDRKYAAAKYQLLMGVKLILHGSTPLPEGNRKGRRYCEDILNIMWDPIKSEEIIQKLIPALNGAASAENDDESLSRDSVRTLKFTENFKKEVLKIRSQIK
ncbi:AIPR family protein [Nocardiopsis protaetiae]|uniref:AIPR family protein n=1 Tax=Nocardiopsis protaetiae TaxID=3382270 RepID=UPI00387B1A11